MDLICSDVIWLMITLWIAGEASFSFVHKKTKVSKNEVGKYSSVINAMSNLTYKNNTVYF